MKLVIKTQTLLKMLTIANDVIPAKTPDPFYLNVLLTVKEEGCEMLASDGKTSITITQLNKDKEGNDVILESEEGSIQLPAKLSREIISKIAMDVVTLEQVDTSILTISDERTTYNINTKPGEEYPDIELVPNMGEEIEIKPTDFMTLYNATNTAVALKNVVEIYLGINIRCENKQISFSATNGFRLAKRILPIDSDAMLNINCPIKVLQILSRIDNLKTIRIRVVGDKVSFTTGNITLTSKTIEGDFILAERLLPQAYPYKLHCSSKELTDILDRVSIVTSDDKGENKRAKLYFNGDHVEISSRSASYGYSVERFDNCTFEGDKFTIYFNSDYVKEVCKSLEEDDITIMFVGDVKLFRITNKDQNNIQLLTPIRPC